jgi:hypothetical protein
MGALLHVGSKHEIPRPNSRRRAVVLTLTLPVYPPCHCGRGLGVFFETLFPRRVSRPMRPRSRLRRVRPRTCGRICRSGLGTRLGRGGPAAGPLCCSSRPRSEPVKSLLKRLRPPPRPSRSPSPRPRPRLLPPRLPRLRHRPKAHGCPPIFPQQDSECLRAEKTSPASRMSCRLSPPLRPAAQTRLQAINWRRRQRTKTWTHRWKQRWLLRPNWKPPHA